MRALSCPHGRPLAIPINQPACTNPRNSAGLPAYRLVREAAGQVVLVPDEAPPLNRQGKEWWPPGWGPGRRAQSQRDVFELVGLPYREPWERDCP